jgi:hypothetical protein
MTSSNLFKRLTELLPADPLLLGSVTVQHPDGTATVTFPGGGAQRLRDPLQSALGSQVFVQGNAITGPAPALPFYELEV